MDVPVDPVPGSPPTAPGADSKATPSATAATNDHHFQKAISSWRQVGLQALMPELDSSATEIVENQKEALAQRKDLAQKTKDFRKLDDADKLTEIKALLKVYQKYIDLLTGHEKKSTSAFLQLYTPVSEAPDPYPLLEASVDSLLISQDTVPRLNSENDQLQRQVSNLTRDIEISEKRLQEERAKRKGLEEGHEEKRKEIEAKWKGVLEDSKKDWDAKEQALQERVSNHDRLVEELKANYEVSQRLEDGTGTDSHRSYASTAELELVTSDLEKTAQRLAETQAKNEQLRLELAEITSNAPKKVDLEDEPDFIQLRTENASILRKLDAAKLEKDKGFRQLTNRTKSLEKDLSNLSEERENLQSKLLQWRDYPDIKRELEVFKAIELSTEDDDGVDVREGSAESHNKTNGSAMAGKHSLEQLLLARNKKLNNDLAELRVSQQELQSELNTLRKEALTTNAELEKTMKLNAALESDLTTLQQEASNTFSGARSVVGRGYAPSSYATRTRKSSPTSSIISGFSPYDNIPSSATASLDALRSGEAVGGGSGILPMVQAQRDRFKKKNGELEAEVQKQHQTISSLRQEVASLQKDNLNLYEKTRFVSTHQRSNAGAYAAGASSTTGSSSAFAAGASVEDRYRPTYEANTASPLTAFRGREAARAYKRLSRPERAVFSLARLVLAGRTSRNIFAAYCVLLHVLIFVMLYWLQGLESGAHHAGAAAAAMANSLANGGAASGKGAGLGAGGASGDGALPGFGEDSLDKGALR